MKHGREWWSRQVQAWRNSGLSQAEYCGQHGLLKGTLGYWSSKLGRESKGTELVEVSGTGMTSGSARPIELVVGGRYLMRLWPGTDRHHLGEILSVLEDRI